MSILDSKSTPRCLFKCMYCPMYVRLCPLCLSGPGGESISSRQGKTCSAEKERYSHPVGGFFHISDQIQFGYLCYGEIRRTYRGTLGILDVLCVASACEFLLWIRNVV